MRDEKKLDQAEKKRRLDIIAANADGEYWAVLKLEIQEEIDRLNRALEKLNRSRMAEKDLLVRDNVILQIESLKKFLGINELLIDRYTSFLEQARDYVSEIWEKTASFVGKV